MPNRSFRTVNILVALAIIVLASGMLVAQSGRRLPKGSPPIVTPTPTPELVQQSKPPPQPDFILKVYSDIELGSTFGLPMPERMQRWAVERLKKTPLLDVRDAGLVNRRDAIKQAKVETAAYVVLLELEADPFVPYGTNAVRAMQLHLTVYHPVTAKVKFKRTLAIGQNSTRLPGTRTVLQACNPGLYGNELLLLEASIEAADSVMNTFNVPLPPLCSGTGI
ncbi:MAG TPA: hypothetical protein PLP21_07190 [Pyrinomonadaceae bacterium]|nr:hypothetical protein [Acidobacteriota bacterium]HQZ96088.1 hypothetical protein [Pyrinomonadaceae bacterium]